MLFVSAFHHNKNVEVARKKEGKEGILEYSLVFFKYFFYYFGLQNCALGMLLNMLLQLLIQLVAVLRTTNSAEHKIQHIKYAMLNDEDSLHK